MNTTVEAAGGEVEMGTVVEEDKGKNTAAQPSQWAPNLIGSDTKDEERAEPDAHTNPPPPEKEDYGGFWGFLRLLGPLGLLAFGGPSVHVSLLQSLLVDQKRIVDEASFLELFALCQALPGPSSTQLIIIFAVLLYGIEYGPLMFLMWGLPVATVLTIAGLGFKSLSSNSPVFDYLEGLAPAGVALIFNSVYSLWPRVCKRNIDHAIALATATIFVLFTNDKRLSPLQTAWLIPGLMVLGGIITLVRSQREKAKKNLSVSEKERAEVSIPTKAPEPSFMDRNTISAAFGACLIGVWLVALVVLVTLRFGGFVPRKGIVSLFELFYRTGSLVHGGGQVVVPLLLPEMTGIGWITDTEFFEGFALVQAMPGPVFNVSAFLGAVALGLPGAVVSWIGLSLPGLLLVVGVCPYWVTARKSPMFKEFLEGVKAVAIGLIAASGVILAFKSVKNGNEAAAGMVSAGLVACFKCPIPVAIIVGGLLGLIFSPHVLSVSQKSY